MKPFRIERFGELYPRHGNSSKGWKVEKTWANSIIIKVNKEILLYGLILAGSCENRIVFVNQIMISNTTKQAQGLLYSNDHKFLLKEKSEDVHLMTYLKIEQNKEHTITVLYESSVLYNGKPSSRKKLEDASQTVFLIEEPVYEIPYFYGGNNKIGGPILGFIYSFID